jgi:hypothetical protein
MIQIIKKYKISILIVIIFLILKLPLLFTYGNYLSGDESVVYLVAKHKEKSLFFYKQAYGGGHTIEAFIASYLFALFGMSPILLKSIPLFFSLLIILFSYYFLNKYFNKSIALTSVLLLLLSDTFLEPGFTVNGYIETMFFALLSMYLFFEIYFNCKEDNKTLILFGFISGIAYWSFETSLFFVLLYLILFFINDKLFFIKKQFLKWFIAFLIGSFPMLFILIRNKLSNFRDIISIKEYNLITHFFISLKNLLIKELPLFFGLENVHNFIDRVPLTNWLMYLVFMISFLYLIIINKKNIIFLIKNKKINNDSKELIFVIFIIIYMLFYSVSVFAGVAPRYLLPIFPYTIFLISIYLIKMNKKIITISILTLLIMIGLLNHYNLYKRGFVIDGIVKTNYRTLPRIIQFLTQNNINHIYTTYFLKWRIIAYTNEDIIASCNHLCPCKYRYPLYENIIEKSDKFAYLFHNSSSFVEIMESSFQRYNITYKKQKIDDKIIFIDLSRPLRPDFIKKCGWLHGFQ